MLLAIDAGNTNTVFAVFDGKKLLGKWRLSTSPERTVDEYALSVIELMRMMGIDYKGIGNVIISSVVPRTIFPLKTLARQYFKAEPLVVGENNVKIGIEVLLERRNEVGADRLVNAVAAHKLYGKAAVIIDFGTATTFDVINENGDYFGGVIAPGINLSLDALKAAAAKLPDFAIERPAKVIGNSTVSAMQSGIYWGYIGLIEGITARIKEEFARPAKVIATGGLAGLYAKATNIIEYLEPDLTLYGLQEIFLMNG